MNSLRYLNTMLTVIALMLAMQLWTSMAGTPIESVAYAGTRTVPTGGGIPNAGNQRKQTVDLLKKLNQQTGQLISMFASGKARVRVEGATQKDKNKEQ